MDVKDNKIVEIRGSKGGAKKPRTPVEHDDTLRSISRAKILIALGEGEFEGIPTAKDIYLDGTPIEDSNGNVNFPDVKWEYRSGSVDQDYIPGMPSVENEVGVNYEVKKNSPYITAINDTQLSAVRVRLHWPSLQRQVMEDERIAGEKNGAGDLVGVSVEYAIDVSTDGGPYQEVLRESVTGKASRGYERSRRIDLPTASTGWQLRVRRLTPDSDTQTIQDVMWVTGLTEIIDAKLRYPNTALLFVEFDAEQFQNIPKISVRIKGRGWPVPSNYNPLTRTYVGVWDGTFKHAWTDNPVWISYGIIVQDRFGLGKRIKPHHIDKWELYRISQYCDQLVPDGKGGMEPRHTCNIYIQSKAAAWEVLRDLAAIYRGMMYWSHSQMTMVADMPRDVDYIFTRANVIDGRFTYSGGKQSEVYTRALVSWDNPDNMYETDIASVSDQRLQRRFGDSVVELSAIGCTRQSEAQRRGKWAIYTNSRFRQVSFQVGLDGEIPVPGDVIGVADPLLAGRPIGGRIKSVSSNGLTITLDRNTEAEVNDVLYVNLPDGSSEKRTITSVSDSGATIGISSSFSIKPESEAQWAIESNDLVVQQFTVVRVTRVDDHIIEIQGIEYDPSKFTAIDNSAQFEERPITVIPPGSQAPPTNVELESNNAVYQGLNVATMTISWDPPPNAVAYDVEWRRDDKDWVRMPRTGSTSVDVQGIYQGMYLARVRAINAADISSIWAVSELTELGGKEGGPPPLAYFIAIPLVFGIQLEWGFATSDVFDTDYTEIQYNTIPDEDTAMLLTMVPYPDNVYTMMGLKAGEQFYFRARIVDKLGNQGEWTEWILGESETDADDILDYIVGKIEETHLGNVLLSEIKLISGDGPGSVNDRIREAIEEYSLNTEYDPNRTYSVGEMVVVNNRIYQAINNVPPENPPPNPMYWLDIGSLSQELGALAIQVEENNTLIEIIDGEVNALAEQTSLIATQVGENAAAIISETQARVNADQAIASSVTTLASTVGDTSAAVESISEAINEIDGQLSATHVIKVGINLDGKYYAAGMGVGVENTQDGMQSQVLFLADRLALLTEANGNISSPFAVESGQTFISDAYIKDGMITNAKIGEFIQSFNYNPITNTGWRIDKYGSATFDNIIIRDGAGNVVLSSNTGMEWDFINGTQGVTLDAIKDVVQDFNIQNNRDGSAIVINPVFHSSPATYTTNDDGSVNVSVVWRWQGDPATIDGFELIAVSRSSSASYTLGTNPRIESVRVIPANPSTINGLNNSYSYTLEGVPSNNYYTFFVRAYRKIDKDVISSGILYSNVVKYPASGTPYRPNSAPNFTGNIKGISSDFYADILSDNVLDPSEKQILAKDWEELIFEYRRIRDIANALSPPLSLSTLNSTLTTLGNSLSSVPWSAPGSINTVPNYLTNLSVSSPVNGTTLRDNWRAYANAVAAMLNSINGRNVNSYNKITSDNISTYIANLAVDTLQIRGNAVSVPDGASSTVAVPLPIVSNGSPMSSFALLNNITTTIDLGTVGGQRTAVTANITVQNNGGDGSVYIWVYRLKNGVYTYVSNDYASLQGGRSGIFTTIGIDKSPGNGNVTYHVRVGASHGSMSAVRYSCVVEGLKR